MVGHGDRQKWRRRFERAQYQTLARGERPHLTDERYTSSGFGGREEAREAIVLLDEVGRARVGREDLERTSVSLGIFVAGTPEDWLTGKVTQGHLAQPRKPVFPAHGHTDRIGSETLDGQSLEVARRDGDGESDIQRAVSQPAQYPPARHLSEIDADVRMRPRE